MEIDWQTIRYILPLLSKPYTHTYCTMKSVQQDDAGADFNTVKYIRNLRKVQLAWEKSSS